jgi:hypothetical protein
VYRSDTKFDAAILNQMNEMMQKAAPNMPESIQEHQYSTSSVSFFYDKTEACTTLSTVLYCISEANRASHTQTGANAMSVLISDGFVAMQVRIATESVQRGMIGYVEIITNLNVWIWRLENVLPSLGLDESQEADRVYQLATAKAIRDELRRRMD